MAGEAMCFLCGWCKKTPSDNKKDPNVEVNWKRIKSSSPSRNKGEYPPLPTSVPAALGALSRALSKGADSRNDKHTYAEPPDSFFLTDGDCSCGTKLLPDALFCRTCGKKRAAPTENLKVLEELEQMAKKLKGNMQKFPKSGKKIISFGGGPQNRYFAVVPGPISSSKTEIERWKEGRLAYWENAASYKRKEAPKGFVNLLLISKVAHLPDEHDSRGVLVKHKDGDKAQELIILSCSEHQAKEWSYLLYEFLATLRGQGDHDHDDG